MCQSNLKEYKKLIKNYASNSITRRKKIDFRNQLTVFDLTKK